MCPDSLLSLWHLLTSLLTYLHIVVVFYSASRVRVPQSLSRVYGMCYWCDVMPWRGNKPRPPSPAPAATAVTEAWGRVYSRGLLWGWAVWGWSGTMSSTTSVSLLWLGTYLPARRPAPSQLCRLVTTINTFSEFRLPSVRLAFDRSQVRLLAVPLPSSNLGQVVHTRVPLSPSSIIWYRPKRREGNGRMWERCGLPPT